MRFSCISVVPLGLNLRVIINLIAHCYHEKDEMLNSRCHITHASIKQVCATILFFLNEKIETDDNLHMPTCTHKFADRT